MVGPQAAGLRPRLGAALLLTLLTVVTCLPAAVTADGNSLEGTWTTGRGHGGDVHVCADGTIAWGVWSRVGFFRATRPSWAITEWGSCYSYSGSWVELGVPVRDSPDAAAHVTTGTITLTLCPDDDEGAGEEPSTTSTVQFTDDVSGNVTSTVWNRASFARPADAACMAGDPDGALDAMDTGGLSWTGTDVRVQNVDDDDVSYRLNYCASSTSAGMVSGSLLTDGSTFWVSALVCVMDGTVCAGVATASGGDYQTLLVRQTASGPYLMGWLNVLPQHLLADVASGGHGAGNSALVADQSFLFALVSAASGSPSGADCVALLATDGTDSGVGLSSSVCLLLNCEYCSPQATHVNDSGCNGCLSASSLNPRVALPPFYVLSSPEPNACMPATTCDATEIEAQAPGREGDRVCAAQTVCDEGEYEVAPPGGDDGRADRVCAAYTVCPEASGFFIAVEGTATSDVQCGSCADVTSDCTRCTGGEVPACTECAPGTYHDVALNSCATLSECLSAEYEIAAPTATSDRVCGFCDGSCTDLGCFGPASSQCTQCGHGSYQVVKDGAAECRTVFQCAPGTQYVASPATPTSDAVCASVEQCDSETQYVVSVATATTQTVCGTCHPDCRSCVGPQASQCTGCPEGHYETAAAAGSSLVTCQALTQCAAHEWESIAASATSDRVCETCSTCPEGGAWELVSFCSATADTGCSLYPTQDALVLLRLNVPASQYSEGTHARSTIESFLPGELEAEYNVLPRGRVSVAYMSSDEGTGLLVVAVVIVAPPVAVDPAAGILSAADIARAVERDLIDEALAGSQAGSETLPGHLLDAVDPYYVHTSVSVRSCGGGIVLPWTSECPAAAPVPGASPGDTTGVDSEAGGGAIVTFVYVVLILLWVVVLTLLWLTTSESTAEWPSLKKIHNPNTDGVLVLTTVVVLTDFVTDVLNVASIRELDTGFYVAGIMLLVVSSIVNTVVFVTKVLPWFTTTYLDKHYSVVALVAVLSASGANACGILLSGFLHASMFSAGEGRKHAIDVLMGESAYSLFKSNLIIYGVIGVLVEDVGQIILQGALIASHDAGAPTQIALVFSLCGALWNIGKAMVLYSSHMTTRHRRTSAPVIRVPNPLAAAAAGDGDNPQTPTRKPTMTGIYGAPSRTRGASAAPRPPARSVATSPVSNASSSSASSSTQGTGGRRDTGLANLDSLKAAGVYGPAGSQTRTAPVPPPRTVSAGSRSESGIDDEERGRAGNAASGVERGGLPAQREDPAHHRHPGGAKEGMKRLLQIARGFGKIISS